MTSGRESEDRRLRAQISSGAMNWCGQVFLFGVCSAVLVQGASTSHVLQDLQELDRDCASYDSCSTVDFFRTCSCEIDCYRYGTCCRDADAFRLMSSRQEEWDCLAHSVPTPVFVKRSCSSAWSGDESVRGACTNETDDIADLLGRVLVSSNATMATYRNWNCALCNGELTDDLFFWTVVVACPMAAVHQISASSRIKDIIVYSEPLNRWGIRTRETFYSCSLTFTQPGFLRHRLRYCAANITSTCPPEWADEEVRSQCHRYHGERKWTTNDRYFRNVHCAVCNDAPVERLGCFGRNYDRVEPKVEGYRKRVSFDANERGGCQRGEKFDPFLRRCRIIECGLGDPNSEPHLCSSGNRIMNHEASILSGCVVMTTFVTLLRYQ